eukprot:jgi/Galph1/3418/GphlegSOOS_G2103.1
MALSEDSLDPLLVEEHDPYWKEVEPYFRPFNKTDLSVLRALKTYGGNDPHLELPPLGGYKHDAASEEGMAERTQARLNSFPFTQRVIAALIDIGDGEPIATSTVKLKGNVQEEPLWKGFSDRDTQRYYQEVLEQKVKEQLRELGLIRPEDDDQVQTRIRDIQWRLRSAKHDARIRRNNLLSKVTTTEAKRQQNAREIKAHNDDLEIFYLSHMFRKHRKNKKQKTRYQKLLNSLFPACRGWKENDIENFRGRKLISKTTLKKTSASNKNLGSKESTELARISEGLESSEYMSDALEPQKLNKGSSGVQKRTSTKNVHQHSSQ